MFFAWELDSVRTNSSEVSHAFDSVMDRLASNENEVLAITFNQIADSLLFLSIIDTGNPQCLNALVNMFKQKVRISPYNGYNNIRDYIQSQRKNENNKFMYSALAPIGFENFPRQNEVLQSIYNAIDNQRTKHNNWIQELYELGVTKKQAHYIQVYAWFLSEIFRLPNSCYLSPKINDRISFIDCMDIAYSVIPDNVCNYLKQIKNSIGNVKYLDNRSTWNIANIHYKSDNHVLHIEAEEAEKVIDTVYNIVVESSINGVESITGCINEEKKKDYFLTKYGAVKKRL